MKLRLLGDNFLVRTQPLPARFGLLYAIDDFSYLWGDVIAVGPGAWAPNGKRRVEMPVKVGDHVAFHRWHSETRPKLLVGEVLQRIYASDDVRDADTDKLHGLSPWFADALQSITVPPTIHLLTTRDVAFLYTPGDFQVLDTFGEVRRE